jgi:hypothetical protein
MNINLNSEIEIKKEKKPSKPKMSDIFQIPKGLQKTIIKKELQLKKKKAI